MVDYCAAMREGHTSGKWLTVSRVPPKFQVKELLQLMHNLI